MSFIRVDESAKTMVMEPFGGLKIQRQSLSPTGPAPPMSPSISQAFMYPPGLEKYPPGLEKYPNYGDTEPEFDTESRQSSISPVLHQLADCRQRLQEVQDAQQKHRQQTNAEMERHKHQLGKAIDALRKGLQHQRSQEAVSKQTRQTLQAQVESSVKTVSQLRRDFELLKQDTKVASPPDMSVHANLDILEKTVSQHEETLHDVQNQLDNLSIRQRPGWALELDRINRELNQECFEIREKLDRFRCLGFLTVMVWGVTTYWVWASSAVVPEAVLY